MWLFGLAAYHACARSTLKPTAGLALWIASIIGMAVVLLPVRIYRPLWQDVSLDPGHLWDYGHYYLLAALFTANIIGFRGAAPYMENGLNKFAKPIRWFAATTFAFYLLHLPIIQFVATIEPWGPESLIKKGRFLLAYR